MVGPTTESTSRTSGPVPGDDGVASISRGQLLRRLLLYHAGLAVFLTVLLIAFPASRDYLPIGGISELAERTGLQLTAEPATPPTVVEASGTGSVGVLGHAPRLAMILVGVWLLMLPVSWLHRGIYRTSNYDHSIDETMLILPGVVAGIVVVVQHSLALAFALAGVAAGVRFRRALQDTFDAQFILMAIGAGIAAGVGALEIVAVMSVFFCYATLYLCSYGDGLHSDFKGRQKEEARRQLAENEETPAGPVKPDSG